MGMAQELSEYAAKLRYEDLPSNVVHQTKRMVLDTLGCALGGYPSESSRVLREFAVEAGHPPEATIFGSDAKSSALLTTLINGAMVRYLDYNDTAFILQGDIYRSGYHPSEVIPGILALAESEKLDGRRVLSAINLGYDVSLAWLEGVVGTGIEKQGWNGDTRGAYVMPLVAGHLLGMAPEQMVHAIGIAGSCHAVFGILDTPAEEYTMTKNIRFPTMAQAGLQAAFLARKGFTGPQGMIDGHDGLIEVMMRGAYDPEPLHQIAGKWSILNTCIKTIIADFSSHGHLTATLKMAREHDIRPEDVAAVRIRTSKRCAEHTGDPVKKYPKNKETADHSSYWLTAIAIMERQIGPNQFRPDKYTDPQALELIDKVELVGDPSLDKLRPAGESTITLKDGRELSTFVDYPRGHAKNPMTDQELIAKFRDVAGVYLSDDRMDRLIEQVFDLENLHDVSGLTDLLVADKSSEAGV